MTALTDQARTPRPCLPHQPRDQIVVDQPADPAPSVGGGTFASAVIVISVSSLSELHRQDLQSLHRGLKQVQSVLRCGTVVTDIVVVNDRLRPLEGPDRGARLVPFISVALVGLFSLAVPPWPRAGPVLVAGIAALGSVIICSTVLPWSRWPARAQAAPPLAFYLALALLRHANGGSDSGLAPLAALPVAWLALHGVRGEMVAAVVGCGTMFVAPAVLFGEPLYPAHDWRRGLLWAAVGVVLGTSIQRLVRSGERHAAGLDALLNLSRRMDVADPATARAETCGLAREIIGARLSVLMEPDGAGNLVSTSDNGLDLPQVTLPLTGKVAGSVIAFTMDQRVFVADAVNSSLVSEELVKATGVASILFEPIRREGRVIGVLCLGFSTVRKKLDREDTVIVELIARQFATVTTRVDLLARLEALAADASDLVGRYKFVDNKFRFSYASPSSYTLLGRLAETLIGTSPMDLVHDDDRASVARASADVLDGRSTVTASYRVAHADGHWVWVETTVRPIIDVLTGRVSEVQATTRDISARKRMEMELRRANALFAGVLGAATDYSIVATDLDGIITIFNVGAERLLGYSAKELVGRVSPDILHDPVELADRARELDPEPGFEAFVKLVRQGGADRREWTYIAKDGRRIHVLLSITAMRDHDGLVTGFIGIAENLIERDTALGQLRDAYEREQSMVAQLHDLASARDHFVSAVTHDLRTPLTSIRGYAEMLLESADDLGATRHKMLGVIDRNAERLLRMVDDLLAVARMEAGKLQLVMVPVNLAQLIDELCQGFQPEAARRHLTLDVHADRAVGVVHVDSHHIERALLNLVSNAIKFTPDGGRVTLDAHRDDDMVTVTITDTGVGIPEAEVGLLFTQFNRASTATDRHTPGTGLGLTIAKAIVEQHGGTISLGSEAGVGTTVTVCLPAIPTDPSNVGPVLEGIPLSDRSLGSSRRTPGADGLGVRA